MTTDPAPADAEKVSIVLFSGTTDKLFAATIIASGAAAMQKQVTIFLTFWGLMAFRKGAKEQPPRISVDFADYADSAMEAMRTKKVPHWLDTLRDAVSLGDVKIKACGMTMDLFGLKLSDLEPDVSEVTGVGAFVEASAGGQTLFI